MRPPIAVALTCVVWVLVHASSSEAAGFWLDVPYVEQEKNGCGAAALSMILQYWQKSAGAPSVPVDAAEIMRRLYSKEAKGILASDMDRFIREQGFRSFVFSGAWQDLEGHVSKGRPLIVSIREGLGPSALHYVVVTGVMAEEGVVLLNDPARRKALRMDRARFEKRWSSTHNWTLLALPPVRGSW
jgi:predicted double-glycine peptidase